MNILAIDTTGKTEIIVAQLNSKTYIKEYNCTKHSETLLDNVQSILHKGKCSLSDIDVFGVVNGPGSFTGIRIGVATIKAFAFALHKPVVCANRFEIIASGYSGYSLLSCTKSSVYYCNLDNMQYGVCDNDQLSKAISLDSNIIVLANESVGSLDCYNNVQIVDNYAQLLLPYLMHKVQSGDTCTSNQVEPLYIQVSQAERMFVGK